jgi:pimeloyl-ACP methyl ester carboxylesterase
MNWLLLRGLGRHEKHWSSFPETLKEHLNKDEKVLTLNLPGMNGEKTSFVTISDITDELRKQWFAIKQDKEDWGLMAISLGGMIALDWCSRYPEDFKKLVTINSSDKSESKIFERIKPSAIKLILRSVFKPSILEREKGALQLTTNLLDINSQLIHDWERIAIEHPLDKKIFARQLFAASLFKSPKVINVPYLVLASSADRFTSYKCSQRLAQKYNASIKVHTSAGHDLPLDDPKWVIQSALEF